MFKFGPKCPRCDERNPSDADSCEHCGWPLHLDRPAILRDNRWEAAPDELAVFFKTRNLKGLFSKTVHVPAGMKAWVMQGSRCEIVREGEHPIANLFEQLNALFTANHGEVLITRLGGVAVRFVFDDVPCADLLALTVECSLVFKIKEGGDPKKGGDLGEFRQTFMGRPGVITTRHLQELLRSAVRQVLLETLAPHGIEALQARPGLRGELERALQGLETRLSDYGLQLDGVEAISVRHDCYDAQKQLKGQLWIEYEEEKARHEHKQRLADLYTAEQLDRYKAARAALRRRMEEGELKADEDEFAEVLRHKELDRLKLIKDAETRKRAIELGAEDDIARLEHTLADSRGKRADEQQEWQHVRELARVRYEAELKVAEIQRDEKIALERRRFEQTLERQRVQDRIELARLEEDAEVQAKKLAAEADALLRVTLREQELLEAEHKLKLDAIEFRRKADRNAAERIEREADLALEEKRLEQERKDLKAKTGAAYEGMKGLLELDWLSRQNELREASEKLALKNKEEDQALERELKRRQEDRADKREEREHEIATLQVLGSLPNAALVLQADTPQKVEALMQMSHVTELSAGRVTAEQIAAIARVLAPQHNTADVHNERAEQFASAGATGESSAQAEESVSRGLFESILDRIERMGSEAQANVKDVSLANSTNGGRTAQTQPQVQPKVQTQDQPPPQSVFVHVSSGQSPAPAARFCTKCGARHDLSANYCGRCGTPLLQPVSGGLA